MAAVPPRGIPPPAHEPTGRQGSAPPARSAHTTLRCPLPAAACSGVVPPSPSRLGTSTAASVFARSQRTTSTRPEGAAWGSPAVRSAIGKANGRWDIIGRPAWCLPQGLRSCDDVSGCACLEAHVWMCVWMCVCAGVCVPASVPASVPVCVRVVAFAVCAHVCVWPTTTPSQRSVHDVATATQRPQRKPVPAYRRRAPPPCASHRRPPQRPAP